jgi:hypothetical protein
MRWLCWLALAACGGFPGGGGGDDDDPGTIDGGITGDGAIEAVGVFDPSVTRVSVEIDFEDGEEPFTGPIVGFGDTFDLTISNVDRIFASTKTLGIPRTTANMENLGAIADEELTVADLLALADAHRSQHDTASLKTYYVVFVSGYFADANGPNMGVLGVSLGTTGVIAMFKDVIRGTNVIGLPNVVRYVEQSTLVHELAHAIGLVDNGVPLTSAHADAPHGAHCTNDACVMYWLNEGANDAAAYAQQHVLTNNTILFDAACLADVDALSGGP